MMSWQGAEAQTISNAITTFFGNLNIKLPESYDLALQLQIPSEHLALYTLYYEIKSAEKDPISNGRTVVGTVKETKRFHL